MALVTCSDCGKQISDAAPACPGCGRPAVRLATMPDRPAPSYSPSVTTVEQTGKRWKAMKLWSALLVFGGVLTMGVSPTAGVLMFFAGVVLYVFARSGAWWHHA